MDTSPEYINMCRKAKELQEKWEPSTGDYCASSTGGCDRILVVIADLNNKFLVAAYPYATYDNTDHLSKQNIKWLPRIDQSLPLIYNTSRGKFCSNNPIDNLKNILDEYVTGERFMRNDLSEEEYFIMVLMYEGYKKLWNGEEWTTQ